MTTANADLLGDKQRLERFLAAERHCLSAFSFVNVFCWQEHFQFRFDEIEGNLCVFAENVIGRFLYLPPLGGAKTPDLFERCFAVMEERNGTNAVSRIENFETVPPADGFSSFLKAHEFCYFKDDIIRLRGEAFKSKRSSFNMFVTRYQHRYVPYEDAMYADCLALYDRWMEERKTAHPDPIYVQMLEDNRPVHALAIGHWRACGLTGRVVIADNRLVAYTFGYALNDDIFCVLFETTQPGIAGLPTFIFRQFCSDEALSRFKFINAMDDFGAENLNRVKMSFRPALLFPSYSLTRKKADGVN